MMSNSQLQRCMSVTVQSGGLSASECSVLRKCVNEDDDNLVSRANLVGMIATCNASACKCSQARLGVYKRES